jgi:hypothetical protein
MLLYTHFVDTFVPAPRQDSEKSCSSSDQSDIEMRSDLKRRSRQALTEHLHQLKSNYSLERRLFG